MAKFARFEPTARSDPMSIAEADVHVWAFALDEAEATVEAWWKVLSDDERRRADRFVFRQDRSRWIVGRGVLRHLLARYCAVDPAVLVFDYAFAGKPSIARGGARGGPVTFNLAHSQDRALLAVARGREIGVDLERLRDNFDPLPIARQFFFGTELEAIEAAAPESRRDAFVRHWVAKEAVLKANGAGLSLPLDSFGVTFDSSGSIARVSASKGAVHNRAVVVRMLPLGAGWHGAVAASGEDWTLSFAA